MCTHSKWANEQTLKVYIEGVSLAKVSTQLVLLCVVNFPLAFAITVAIMVISDALPLSHFSSKNQNYIIPSHIGLIYNIKENFTPHFQRFSTIQVLDSSCCHTSNRPSLFH